MLLAYSSPQGAWLDADKLQSAFRIVAGWVEGGIVPGAVALVARRGRIAGTWAGGHLSSAPDARPVSLETPFAAASITKVVTAITLLRQIDEGKAALDTRAQTILPEWRAPGVERVTLKHLLSHTSGLPPDLPRGTLNYENRNSLDVIVDAFMRLPLRYQPGAKLVYSNAGYGIIGRVVEKLSGKPFREAAWSSVLGPLWMNDTWFGNPPADRAGTIAIVEGTDRPGTDLDPYNGSYFRSLGHTWGGMFSTATDLATLAQLFLENGKPLLNVATALAAIRNWTNGLQGGLTGPLSSLTGDWGLGWEVKGARGQHWTGNRTSHATFGHMGQSGTFVWADPVRDLVCVLLTNRTTSDGWPITGPQRRWMAFSEAVYESIMNIE
jgi:CubicO group peptidase (beta-lactamase class C family)